MKLDYCQTHRGAPVEDAALPCLAIRHDDGRRVTQRELWAEIERLRAELADARNLLCKLRSPHPRLRVEYWTGQWWVPLQGNALDATLAALEPAPKWSVAIGA